MRSTKDKYTDVRYHMNTEWRYNNNLNCKRAYQKLADTLTVRDIRKRHGAYRHQGYFLRTLDDLCYKAKYRMEC